MKVSLVIPAYNEGKLIVQTVSKATQYLRRNFDAYEVIVSDDGSTDDTLKQLEPLDAMVVSFPQNRGKGAAVREGMRHATGDCVFFSDADLSYPLEWIGDALRQFGACDVVRGQRQGNYPALRKTVSAAYHACARTLLGLHDKDIQCGIKGFSARACRDIFGRCRVDGFAFDTEVLFLAHRLGYDVCPLPVELTHREHSNVNVLADGMQMFADLVRIRQWSERGAYDAKRVVT